MARGGPLDHRRPRPEDYITTLQYYLLVADEPELSESFSRFEGGIGAPHYWKISPGKKREYPLFADLAIKPTHPFQVHKHLVGQLDS